MNVRMEHLLALNSDRFHVTKNRMEPVKKSFWRGNLFYKP